MFPDAVALTQSFGMVERVEPNHFNYTLVSYGLDVNGDIIYIHQTSGWYQFLDSDTVQVFGSRAYYAPWQDPYGEEDPEYGCYTNLATMWHRTPVVEPCVP